MQKLQLILLFAVCFVGCDPDKKGGTSDFDRAPMLEQYANQLIIPAYDDLESEAFKLTSAAGNFHSSPTADNLALLQNQWHITVQAWEKANAYNFGPAGEEGVKKSLAEEIATFPADTVQIEAFVAANDLLLNNFNRDTRGFFALDYLLFSQTDLLAQSVLRRDYVLVVARHIVNQCSEVREGWASDTYSATFRSNLGTDSGSSTSLLYNEFVKSFENLKNFKVGLPAGKRPGQTAAEPTLLEGYYAGNSLYLLKLHLNQLKDIYDGRGVSGVDGVGFREYLESVVGGKELVTATDAQWQKVIEAVNAVPSNRSMEQLIIENHPSIEALHTELQKHTRFFKSDMSSLLGIAITFSSGDGD